MTATDLHLLLEQNRLLEQARALAGARPLVAREGLAQLIRDTLAQFGKWEYDNDDTVLSRFVQGEIDGEELKAHFASRI